MLLKLVIKEYNKFMNSSQYAQNQPKYQFHENYSPRNLSIMILHALEVAKWVFLLSISWLFSKKKLSNDDVT